MTKGSFAKCWKLLCIIAVVTIGASTASADTALGTCRPDLPSYDNFSDAVSGTPDGNTIFVCPGTYAEQITVFKNLTISGLQSGNSGLPVIVPPAGGLAQNDVTYNVPSGFLRNASIAAQIIVNPGFTLTINNVSLDASNNKIPNCGPVPVGIYFGNSSGTVNNVAFKNQTATCFFNGLAGLQNYPQGDGVFVQSNGSLPAVVSLQSNSFHNPGWMAIHADGGGANVGVQGNTAVGPGITYGNGILVEGGATASAITNNYESNSLPNGQTTGFWGILLGSCAGNPLVDSNVLSNTQIGINVSCSTSTITNNTIFNSLQDGVDICGSGNTVQNNTINDSGVAGVYLVQGCASKNNLVNSNTIDAACVGELAGTDALNNSIGPDTLINTKYLFLNGSSCSY